MSRVSRELCLRFAEARRAKGLRQTELAAQVGGTQSALSMFESGQPTKLSEETVKKLSEFLGVPLVEEVSPAMTVPTVSRYSVTGRPMEVMILLNRKLTAIHPMQNNSGAKINLMRLSESAFRFLCILSGTSVCDLILVLCSLHKKTVYIVILSYFIRNVKQKSNLSNHFTIITEI